MIAPPWHGCFRCFPKGRLTAECFDWLCSELIGPLKAAVAGGGVDAVRAMLPGYIPPVCED